MNNMRNKILSLLVLLLTAATGAWAEEATITLKCGTTEKTYENVTLPWSTTADILKAVVTGLNFNVNINAISGGDGKVVKYGNENFTVTGTFSGDATVTVTYNMGSSATITVTAPGPDVEVTTNAASEGATFTEASFTMPAFDATVSYELVRDISVLVPVRVGDGKDGFRIRVKKNDQQKFEPAEMTLQDMMALYTVRDSIEHANLAFYGQNAVCALSIYAVGDNDQPTGDAIAFEALTPGRYVAMATAKEGSAYDGVTDYSNIFQLYQKEITKHPEAISGLRYNSEPQTLFTPAECIDGMMRYSLDGQTWSAELPQATTAGTYTVYYKVIADENDDDPNYLTLDVEIAKGQARELTINILTDEIYYNGGDPVLLKIEVTDGGRKLTEGVDYTYELTDNVNVGTGHIVLTGINNYTGTQTKDFTIGKIPLWKGSVEPIAELVYNGEAQTPEPVVWCARRKLTVHDFTVSYADNVDAGTATMTLTATDVSYYVGQLVATFTIVKAAGSIAYAEKTVKKHLNETFTHTLNIVGDGTVTYESSNTEVATVDAKTGQVKTLAPGKTVITATVADGKNYTYAVTTAQYTLEVDTTVGIQGVQADEDGNTWYDMNGRRLQGKPVRKGMYLKNGKKVVIK